jgi:ABC-type Fe3+-hydroxamate transport system substrate-binding protein
VKREKRRLDDLLTIRENELEKLAGYKTKEEQTQQLISEMEKKIKHMEKKHEKVVTKMQADISKYKKRSEQY